MSRVYTIVKAHVKTWFRSKSTIFWTLAFPLLLIVLFGVISAVTSSYAAKLSNSTLYVSVQQVPIVTRNTRYIDFFIPGVIGMTLLTSGVFGAVNTNGRYRELKIIKKLATTPLSKIEWILGMVGYQMILATISLVVILFFGYALFGVTATIDIYTVGLVVAAALLFPGIGMVLANFVKEAESADAAANAITFPMMFLAGTFWPRETLPDIMKIIANFMPLTYVNDGLRDALIYAQPAQALTNTKSIV